MKQTEHAPTKTDEVRVRRRAARQGLRLQKCLLRDPRALGYGTYRLVDDATNALVLWAGPSSFGVSLAQAERYLLRGVR